MHPLVSNESYDKHTSVGVYANTYDGIKSLGNNRGLVLRASVDANVNSCHNEPSTSSE